MNNKKLLRACIALGAVAGSGATLAQPAIAWTRTTALTLASQNALRYIRTDAAGNTFVARLRGFRNTSAAQGYTQIQKLSPTGVINWTVNLVGHGSGLGAPFAMTVDNAGNVVVTDFDFYSVFNQGVSLTKLNGANGAQLWRTSTFTLNFYGQTTLACDSANNVFMLGQSGSTGDVRIGVTKFNGATGAALWAKPLVRVGAGQSDFASALEIDAGNNVAVVGTVESSDPCNTTFKSPIVSGRLRGTDGATLWAKTYNNVATDDNFGPVLDVDATGNLYVASTTSRVAGLVWTIAKFAAANGATTFGKIYSPASTFLSSVGDIEVDGSGGFAFCGAAFGMTGGGTGIARWTAAGAQSWSKILADRNQGYYTFYGAYQPRLIAAGTSLYTVATRDTTTTQNPTSVTIVNKIVATTGANSWERLYNGAGNSQTQGVGITVAPNGDAVIANNVLTGNMSNPYSQGAVVRMASSNGTVAYNNIAANTVIGTPDYGRDVIVDAGGFVYTTGGSAGRIVSQKFNSAGTLVWQNIYDDAALAAYSQEIDGGEVVAKDGAGNVVVLGKNRGKAVILKLSNTTGGVLWAKQFAGEPGRNLVINGTGDIYVPFESPSQVLKLATATGNTLWTSPVDGPGASDSCFYVALDSTGNPFVTGQTTNQTACAAEPDQKVFVQRMNPTTGAKLWLTTLATANAGQNAPVGLALDSSKNVLVGGNSENATNTDFFAAKMNGTSGAVLWNTKHDDSGRFQYATAMVMDGANNIAITGATYNGTTSEGFTIKVLNSNGARAWTNRLTLPAGNKFASDIARDGANNFYVGGGIGTASTGQRYGQKINGANGATLWNAVTNNAVGSLGVFTAGVAVSTTNRMHLVGATTSAGTGLGNQVLYQYNP